MARQCDQPAGQVSQTYPFSSMCVAAASHTAHGQPHVLSDSLGFLLAAAFPGGAHAELVLACRTAQYLNVSVYCLLLLLLLLTCGVTVNC